MLRVLRLTASPHVIAMGVAAGSFASFTPFLGFHFVTAWIICFFTRGSYFAGAVGTFFGNPLTFPFIWASTLAVGRVVLHGGDVSAAANFETPELTLDLILYSFNTVLPVMQAMLIGSVPVGVPVCIVIYFIVRKMAQAYQNSRLKMLADKARSDLALKLEQSDHQETNNTPKMTTAPITDIQMPMASKPSRKAS